jgi:hypothetical protein
MSAWRQNAEIWLRISSFFMGRGEVGISVGSGSMRLTSYHHLPNGGMRSDGRFALIITDATDDPRPPDKLATGGGQNRPTAQDRSEILLIAWIGPDCAKRQSAWRESAPPADRNLARGPRPQRDTEVPFAFSIQGLFGSRIDDLGSARVRR